MVLISLYFTDPYCIFRLQFECLQLHVITCPSTYQVIHGCEGTMKIDSRLCKRERSTKCTRYHVAGADSGKEAADDCCQRRHSLRVVPVQLDGYSIVM